MVASKKGKMVGLRGLRWRVLLGVLPAFPASIVDLRRKAADGRRRYAELRRRVLVDPHLMEDMQKPQPAAKFDDPLSQDPDSVWSRYFRNAEIEKTIEMDVARLYPEHGGFFQSPGWQATLCRILLIWSLHHHPHHIYQQGMHELLAPLLYTLHSDAEHFSEVKRRYGDFLDDKFDGLQAIYGTHDLAESVVVTELEEEEEGEQEVEEGEEEMKAEIMASRSLPLLRTTILGNDSYGAEGELGCLLSEKFIEHDAYAMFDALMTGGSVPMAEFFSRKELATNRSPVLEASAALYRALAVTDRTLHSHLCELGVEPQFFALRWLRVLFGREFELHTLLKLWDAIFSEPNLLSSSAEGSDRSAFILGFAVSMILQLRPSLLSTSNATACLQKLLSFPHTLSVRSLIQSAKTIQPLIQKPCGHSIESNKRTSNASHLFQASLQKPPLVNSFPDQPVLDSYWEAKWNNSVLPKALPEDEEAWEPPKQGVEEETSKTEKESNVPGTDIDMAESRSSLSRAILSEVSPCVPPTEHLLQQNLIAECSNSNKGASFADLEDEVSTESELSGNMEGTRNSGEFSRSSKHEKNSQPLYHDGSADLSPDLDSDILDLQTLGHLMLENIHVLERTLEQITPSLITKEGLIAALEGSSDAGLNMLLSGRGGGHSAALGALTKLRKIGNILLQMQIYEKKERKSHVSLS